MYSCLEHKRQEESCASGIHGEIQIYFGDKLVLMPDPQTRHCPEYLRLILTT
jgi:hypothetical protein